MTIVILFVFGAIFGSFLNVWGLRLNSGMTLQGRSHCPSCNKKLSFLELVPIVSYIALWGRCRTCRARIPIQYLLVEILTGLIFVSLPLVYLPVFSLFIVIVIYDVRHKIIPDTLVYTAILLSFVYRWLSTGTTLDWLVGPILFSFFALIWFLSRGRAMGFGDAKLVLAVGLLLGAIQGFSAIVLSFWIGALYGILLMASRFLPLLSGSKKITIIDQARIGMKSELPFAPFIILGAWLSVIFQLDLLHVSLF